MEGEGPKLGGLEFVELGGGEAGQGGVLYVQDGLMQGPSGEQYVTIIQDGQTYAIPAADYAAMMAQQNLEVVEAGGEVRMEEQEEAPPPVPEPPPPPPVTPAPPAPTTTILTPCAPPNLHRTYSNQPTQVKTEMAHTARGVQASAGPEPKTQMKAVGGVGGPSMKWMTTTTPPTKPVVTRTGVEAVPAPPVRTQAVPVRKHAYPTMQQVHKLIMNACTEYFSKLEQSDGEEGAEPGSIDMPGDFTPEALAPIIRFMYTGRLDLKETTYKKMYETAQTLQMSVLTKLMDAQVNSPSVEPDNRKAVKRTNGAFDDDPVEQIRKIRKIEKRVAQEERKKIFTARQRQEELARLPGRKLPIWKRPVPESALTSHKPATEQDHKLLSPPKQIVDGYRIPKLGEDLGPPGKTVGALLTEHLERGEEAPRRREDGQLIPPPVVSTTYTKRSPGEKPKIPRRLQEIQQHLMFEKILKTGTKNTVTKPVDQTLEKSSDLSLEEVKALVEEQKQRMAAINPDEDDEDYYDDSVELGDDYIDAGVDSPAPPEASEEEPQHVHEPEATQKLIRFSLRPNPRPGFSTSEPDPAQEPPKTEPSPQSLPSLPTGQELIDAPSTDRLEDEQEKQHLSINLPEPGPKVEGGIQTELDEALEEFSRVAEEEEAEELREGGQDGQGLGLDGDRTRPRRGRPPRWLKEQTLQMGEMVRRREETPTTGGDQAQIINEVMKKYPNLFKENKQVKIKVMTKDAAGRAVTKLITLKSHQPAGVMGPPNPEPNDTPVPAGLGSLKPVTKVMYTGKRGRPKKVKPGMHDPHQAERKEIEERLLRDYPALANQINKEEQDQEGEEEEQEGEEEYEEEYKQEYSQMSEDAQHTPATNDHQSLDPSSEAEAMSNVASGIAASLGLVEHQYQGGNVMMHDGQLVLAPGGQHQEYLQVLGQASHMGAMQYSIAKDPRLITMNPDQLGLSQGLISAPSAMFASTPTLLPVSSDHLMNSEMVHPGANMMPMVVTSSQMLHTPQHLMLQNAPHMLLPSSSMLSASSMMTPGIVVMAPQVVAPLASQPPQEQVEEAKPKAVEKIVSDWDSDDDQ